MVREATGGRALLGVDRGIGDMAVSTFVLRNILATFNNKICFGKLLFAWVRKGAQVTQRNDGSYLWKRWEL